MSKEVVDVGKSMEMLRRAMLKGKDFLEDPANPATSHTPGICR